MVPLLELDPELTLPDGTPAWPTLSPRSGPGRRCGGRARRWPAARTRGHLTEPTSLRRWSGSPTCVAPLGASWSSASGWRFRRPRRRSRSASRPGRTALRSSPAAGLDQRVVRPELLQGRRPGVPALVLQVPGGQFISPAYGTSAGTTLTDNAQTIIRGTTSYYAYITCSPASNDGHALTAQTEVRTYVVVDKLTPRAATRRPAAAHGHTAVRRRSDACSSATTGSTVRRAAHTPPASQAARDLAGTVTTSRTTSTSSRDGQARRAGAARTRRPRRPFDLLARPEPEGAARRSTS